MRFPVFSAFRRRRLGRAIEPSPEGSTERTVSAARAALEVEGLLAEVLGTVSPDAVDPGSNGFGRRVLGLTFTGTEEAIEVLAGLASTGRRVAGEIGGRLGKSACGALARVAAQGIPLVLHVRPPADDSLDVRTDWPGDVAGRVQSAGGIVFCASGLQDVIDLAVAGRSIAEQTLTPVVILHPALGSEDVSVHVPTPALLHRLPGDPSVPMDTPTAAQRLLFGNQRPRVPAWIDLDRPAATGCTMDQGDRRWGFDLRVRMLREPLPDEVDRVLAEVEALLGRVVIRPVLPPPPGGSPTTLSVVSSFPKRSRALIALGDACPGLVQTEVIHPGDLVPDEAIPPDDLPAPARHMRGMEQRYDNLPRFWGECLQPRLAGEADVPDPAQALAVTPMGTAGFFDVSARRETFPVFSAADCTGCGACWTSCPHSAVRAAALGTRELLAGLSTRFSVPDRVSRTWRSMAAHLDTHLARREAGALTEDVFAEAAAWLVSKLDLSAVEAAASQAALDEMGQCLAPMCVAATEGFFHAAHRTEKGAGRLLMLAASPQACTGCGICAVACEDGAITMENRSADLLGQDREVWSALAALPDTAGVTIAAAAEAKTVDPLAAILLSRHCQLALTGGDPAESGDGARLAIRLIVAVTEYVQQQRLTRRVEQLADLAEQLRSRIRDMLTSALPTEDLDALDRAASQDRGHHAPLADILRRMEGQGRRATVDADLLARMTELAQQLEARRLLRLEGPTGLGRARMAVVITSPAVADWAVRFPANPFACPVVVDPTGDRAPGIQLAFLQDQADEFRLIRLVRTALDHPAEFPRRERALMEAGIDDLPAEERLLCAPVLVIVETAAGRSDTLLGRLLDEDLPLRILTLDDGGHWDRPGHPGWPSLLTADRFVASTSIAHPGHLFDATKGALRSPVPSLLHLHAPTPARNGFFSTDTIRQAALAVRSRVHPLLTLDPARPGVLGTRLDLTGNPAVNRSWVDDDGAPVTPLAWMREGERFADWTLTVSGTPDPADAVPLKDWLQLDLSRRGEIPPYVPLPDGSGSLVCSERTASGICRREAAWRSLQEIAGVVTPFTEQVRRQAEDDLRAEHQRELETLRAGLETQLEALRGQQGQAQVQALRERLITLARASRPPAKGMDLPARRDD